MMSVGSTIETIEVVDRELRTRCEKGGSVDTENDPLLLTTSKHADNSFN